MPVRYLSGPTIAAGAALSNALDVGTGQPVMIFMPVAWDKAMISFQVSGDGVAFADLYDREGREVIATVVEGTAISVDTSNFGSAVMAIKIRSGGRHTPVAQTQERVFSMLVL